MLFRIDTTSSVPLGDQIAACARRAVVGGSVRPGERLPAARMLAGSLGVNVHTVLRGYQQLRDEGLIELRRGRGAIVADGASARARAQLVERVGEFVADALELGLTDDEVMSMVSAALKA
ncbi:GntR family transcriptional regulator [Streptomyces sp. NPDC059002]|uniref:GntR family transcriptional regulator n=1 Tax=Streptomyces sp. NPDC059002 TaxID=3346690 RepID=UPI0036D03583